MRLILLAVALCLGVSAHAELRYRLEPRQIAEGTWLFEGSTENFEKSNGANIVNTAFIVTAEGVVVIDTGPSRRYGEEMREAIAEGRFEALRRELSARWEGTKSSPRG